MRVLYLHGCRSTPGGVKPTFLKEHGHEVVSPALPDDDFEAAERIAQVEFHRHHPDVVVGSSRGGAVAMNIESGPARLVLLCPAWKRWGTRTTVKFDTVILHSRADDVVPFADSEELVRNSCLPSPALFEVGDDHRLVDPESLAKMLAMVESFPARALPARTPEAGVPRQFGVGAMLLITTMYAVLFAFLCAVGAPPQAYAVIGLFFFAIGLGQMFLFKGRRPRRASVIVGTCIWLAGWSVALAALVASGGRIGVQDFAILLFTGAISGVLCGYLAGLLIAGVFLFADKLNRLIGRVRFREKVEEPPTTWNGELPPRSGIGAEADKPRPR